ncbi:P-loop containing nucleoside triphosphate hydrolase protein [Pisolithus marmoratus]|nr:P-loop containing nucleoside triphosphate hydrolase protein [Pisolithus marmoratus]
MGPTGAGKSSFIANATNREGEGVGHDLTSCTSQIKATKCEIEGFSVVLVDTPGFDDTKKSDLDILKLISDWLNAEYQTRPILSAILYFHRISNNRMAGTPLKNFRVFEKLCGKNAMSQVTLVTTMWDEVEPNVGDNRLKELKDNYWKTMISRGSRTFRCNDARGTTMFGSEDAGGSPMDLLRLIVQRKKEQESMGQDEEPGEGEVRLQEEISNMKLEIQETAAGRQLCSRLEELAQRRMQTLRKIREETKRADERTAQDLWREYAEVKNQLDSTLTQARELRMTFKQRGQRLWRTMSKVIQRDTASGTRVRR